MRRLDYGTVIKPRRRWLPWWCVQIILLLVILMIAWGFFFGFPILWDGPGT